MQVGRHQDAYFCIVFKRSVEQIKKNRTVSAPAPKVDKRCILPIRQEKTKVNEFVFKFHKYGPGIKGVVVVVVAFFFLLNGAIV